MICTKEKVTRYLRWGSYICMFLFICVISKTMPEFFIIDNYIQWITLAIPCTLIICIIYTILWGIIDINIAKETIKLIHSKINFRKRP